jgi:hypothetical protein
MAWHPAADWLPASMRPRCASPSTCDRQQPGQAQWPSTQTQPPVGCCAHRPGTQVDWPGGGGVYCPGCQTQVLSLKRQRPGCQTTGPIPGDGGGTISACIGGGGPGATSDGDCSCSLGGCTTIWVERIGGSSRPQPINVNSTGATRQASWMRGIGNLPVSTLPVAVHPDVTARRPLRPVPWLPDRLRCGSLDITVGCPFPICPAPHAVA